MLQDITVLTSTRFFEIWLNAAGFSRITSTCFFESLLNTAGFFCTYYRGFGKKGFPSINASRKQKTH